MTSFRHGYSSRTVHSELIETDTEAQECMKVDLLRFTVATSLFCDNELIRLLLLWLV